MKRSYFLFFLFLSVIFLIRCSQNNVEAESLECNEFTINNGGEYVTLISPIDGNINGWCNYPGSICHLESDLFAQDWNFICPSNNLDCDIGEPIKAVFTGKVIFLGVSSLSGFGKQIVIQSSCDPNYAMRYAHLDDINSDIELGDEISIGKQIGTLGRTGLVNTASAHLHLALYKNITTGNMLSLLSEGGFSSNESYSSKFILQGQNSISPPNLSFPLDNSIDVNIPVDLEWNATPCGPEYIIQISKSKVGWSPDNGFINDTNLVVKRDVCRGDNNSCLGNDNNFFCFDDSYLWENGAMGSIEAPKHSTVYYWSVRSTSSGFSSDFSEPRKFKTEEKVYIGDKVLDTQQKVDDFGANNYTRITGRLTIGGASAISPPTSINTIEALSSLQTIGNDFTIRDNNNLTNISGLENITTIEGQLNIDGNLLLENIDELSSLTRVEANILIQGNDNLANIHGLVNLDYIGTRLDIWNCDNLNSLKGLEKITSINTTMRIVDNQNLTSLEGLENIISVGGDLEISINPTLGNLDGLLNVSNVGQNLIINTNLNLCDLCGIKKVIESVGISGVYQVQGNCFNPTQADILNDICTQ